VGAAAVSLVGASRCEATCTARRPSAPGESAGRSIVGVEVLKGQQRLLERVPGHQQRALREPVLARSIATGGARHGW
jgi:hypothetical protein